MQKGIIVIKLYMQKIPIMKRLPVKIFLGLLAGFFLTLAACQKEMSIEVPVNLTAEGTLKDTTTGDCLRDSVAGTYYNGVEPGRDTAYILVDVNVTNAGSYSIYTNTNNGIYFSDSGYFSAKGLNTIKLKPVGTPILVGPFDYNITFDSTVCTVTINVKDSTGTGLGGGGTVTPTDPNLSDSAWTFTGPAGSYNGPVDTAFESDSAGVHYLAIAGFTQATGDSAWQIGIAFTGGAITTGTFQSTASALFAFSDATNGNLIYSASPQTPTVNTVINITSYDATTKIITGNFSGTALDSGGKTVNISKGTFKARVH